MIGGREWQSALRRIGGPGRALARRIVRFAVLFLATQSIVRLTLAWRVGADYADSAVGLLTPFLVGAVFDVAVFAVFAVPVVLCWLALPRVFKGGRLNRWATVLSVAMFALQCLFTAVALAHFSNTQG